MVGNYGVVLMVLSVGIAAIASHTALALSWPILRATKQSRLQSRLRLIAGAIALGLGIWLVHFLGMLALPLPQPVYYDGLTTGVSLLSGVAGSAAALGLLRGCRIQHRLLLSSVLMGGAIVSTHAIGMMGMQLPAQVHHARLGALLAGAIAVAGSFAALRLIARAQPQTVELEFTQTQVIRTQARTMQQSALLLALTIGGTHYTGVATTRLISTDATVLPTSPAFSSVGLAIACAASTGLVLLLTHLNGRSRQRRHPQRPDPQTAQTSETPLHSRMHPLIHQIQAGVLLLDSQGKILFYNPTAARWLPLDHPPEPEPLFGLGWGLLAEDLRPVALADLPVQQAIARGQAVHNVVLGVPQAEGAIRWLLVHADPSPMLDKAQASWSGGRDGTDSRSRQRGTGGIVCTISDITAQKQLQADLEENRQFLDRLLNSIPNPIFVKDQNHRWIYLNDAFCDLIGRSREELLGRSDYDFLPAEEADVLWKYDDLVMMTGTVHANEERITSLDGRSRLISTQKVSLADVTGRPILVGSIADITERKQQEHLLRQTAEREKAIAHILDSMRQMLDLPALLRSAAQDLRQSLECDRVLVYRFHADWSGEFVAESVGSGWRSILTQQIDGFGMTNRAIAPAACRVRPSAKTGLPDIDTYLQETQGGPYRKGTPYLCVNDIYEAHFSPCYLEKLEQLQARAYISAPIFCGTQLWGLLASYQNARSRAWETSDIKMVTQIAAQLGVAVQQAELWRQTQQQAAELEQLRQTAAEGDRIKAEFLANMSHKLRTHLNAILGFTQLMHHNSNRDSTDQEYLSLISRSGECLLELTSSVLEASEPEASQTRLNTSSFDLHCLLDGLLNELDEMLQRRASVKQVSVTVERAPNLPHYIRTDEQKLRQVLISLLSCAMQLTQGGQVMLHITAQPAKNDTFSRLRFAITTPHSSLKPGELDKLDKLLKPTKPTEPRPPATNQLALELADSQTFVQLMGGEIRVANQPDVGSGFSFEIDARRVNTLPGDAESVPCRRVVGLAPGQPAWRLLVVEDSTTHRLLLVKLLSGLGFEVMEAENGQVALDIWEIWEPHLIWMDMQMPIMDGYEATQRIKSTPRGQQTIIIALTASALEEQQQAMVAAGCDDFVRKPFQREQLLQKISAYLDVRYAYHAELQPRLPRSTQAKSRASDLLHPAALHIMPPEWLTQFHQAVAQGSDRQTLQLIRQIPSAHTPLAQALKGLTVQFQFEQLTALAEAAVSLAEWESDGVGE
ncbi:MAG: response regulator [Cyanobacteria bacterium J069]|nr:MAG: response regulator [Cyanobacteria bacterium J069]